MDHAPELDGFDLRILGALQHDGRLSNVELGERVNLSASQVSRRVAHLIADALVVETFEQARALAPTVSVPVATLAGPFAWRCASAAEDRGFRPQGVLRFPGREPDAGAGSGDRPLLDRAQHG